MGHMKKLARFLSHLTRRYMLLLLFFLALCFVGAFVGYKVVFAKPTYVYAKIKVGQGYWWANTQKPNMWFVNAITKAKEEKDALGKPVTSVLSVIYYPYFGSGQYDVYVTVRLKVSKGGTSGAFNYKRSTIGVGAPIDLEFNSVQYSGTIIALSTKPLEEQYVEKLVTLDKKNAFPWEFDSIQVGDSYFNGKMQTMQVLRKQASDTYTLAGDIYGNYPVPNDELKRYITIQVKLKGQMINKQFIYAEDQAVIPGRGISMATPNYVFNDFTIAKVE